MTETTVETTEKKNTQEAPIGATNNPRKLAEYFMNQCRSWVESGDGFPPMMVAVRASGEKLVLVFEGFSGTMAHLTEQVRPSVPNAYCLLFVDSYVTVDKKLVERDIRVRDVPGRREAVVCHFVSKTNEACVAVWVYDRDAEGKPVFVKNIEWLAESNTAVMEASVYLNRKA